MRLERAEWGTDLPSVETQLETQRHVHTSVEDLGSSVKEARMYEVWWHGLGDTMWHNVCGKVTALGSAPVGKGAWGRGIFKDGASELTLDWCERLLPRAILCTSSCSRRAGEKDLEMGFQAMPSRVGLTGAFFILQGKMSQNFRASYTETLGKLETQYCKLMVSGFPVGFQHCPRGARGPSLPPCS